jgi:glycolate oxidase iron-sulfur subunit
VAVEKPVGSTPSPATDSLQPRRSAFDTLRPPDPDLIDDCVHCGFCLPTCPSYVVLNEEMDSPRGRIYLMDAGHQGRVSLNSTVVEHFDRCLGDMACVTACPSGVQYGKLIEATRAQIERNHRREPRDGLWREVIFQLFPRKERLRVLAWPLALLHASGAMRLLRHPALGRRLPDPRLRMLEQLMPEVSPGDLRRRVPVFTPAVGERRARVALLTGCVQSVFFAAVNQATARVLAAEGCDVYAPPAQDCCGALALHAGREEAALDWARRAIDVFSERGVDWVVTNAAGCGSTMKEYGHVLRQDPVYAERAAAFAEKVKDVTEVLAALGPRARRQPLPLRVAYHDACHLAHAQRVRVPPRDVLRSIPALELLEPAESEICCGSAGIYNLVEPEIAGQLMQRKVRNLLTTQPDAIASGNPGCTLQIRAGLRRVGETVPVLHPVELLDRSIQCSGVQRSWRWRAARG